MKKFVRMGIALLGAGSLLMLAGVCYPMLLSVDSVWPAEDEKQLTEASNEYHRLSYEYAKAINTAREVEMKAKIDAAEKKFHQHMERLDNARSGPELIANILHWTGLGLCACGVFILLLYR